MPFLAGAAVVVIAVGVLLVVRRRRAPRGATAALADFARATTVLEGVSDADVGTIVSALRAAERSRRSAMMTMTTAHRSARVDTLRHFRAIERRRAAATARAEASLPEDVAWTGDLGDDPFTLWAAAQASGGVDADAIMRRLEAGAADESAEKDET
ncbi:MAG TPA: hypothetical protein VLD62_00350 [Acidimicrobiia bacterium]|nr:hypothetical protein [Acidimicrobiia bacterium]